MNYLELFLKRNASLAHLMKNVKRIAHLLLKRGDKSRKIILNVISERTNPDMLLTCEVKKSRPFPLFFFSNFQQNISPTKSFAEMFET